MGQLIAIALATFASEDLTCIATGALIASGQIGLLPGILACATGIYFGDLLLYFAGRLAAGPVARRLVRQERLDRASQWMAERGAAVVLLSRFTPGLRLPTYLAAGILKARFWTFNSYFLLAALLWTPLLVGSAALLGRSLPGAPFALAAALACWHGRKSLSRRLRAWRWEFWPPWLAYLPLIPYLMCLAVKHRSLTLFTAANPGIPSGGFVGESKSAILSQLSRVPTFQVVRPGESIHVDEFPVVLKPDVGERGTGVTIAHSPGDVDRYLATATRDTIIQRYVGGLEFGVFYYRRPHESAGHIFSITEKRFPEVIGDGRSSLRDLVFNDRRAASIAQVYLKCDPERVPVLGERVRLVEIGSHCRGAIFLDGQRHQTPELLAAVDAVAKSHPGFYFGRFDLRTPSIEDFRAGRFQVLELNGVSAEATHIYDPAISVWEAYRVMRRQWRLAFEIGAANRACGTRPMGVRDFARLALSSNLYRSPREVAAQTPATPRPAAAAAHTKPAVKAKKHNKVAKKSVAQKPAAMAPVSK